MKSFLICILLIALGCTNFVNAQVTLKFDYAVDLLSVNQETPVINREGLFSSTKSVLLENGLNQIVFRYEPFFEEGLETRSVSSDIIIAKFEASDTEVQLKTPSFSSFDAAEDGIVPLNWKLTDANGTTIAHLEDILVKQGIQFGRDFSSEAASYNARRGKASIELLRSKTDGTELNNSLADEQKTIIQHAPENVAPRVNLSVQINEPKEVDLAQKKSAEPVSTAEEMLHFWYAKADAKTRARFKAYINEKK